jgi:glutamyl-tRNA reductase
MIGAKRLICLGLSHKTAPVALRERLAFSPKELGRAAALLQGAVATAAECAGAEATVLSTCNRVELYAVFPRAVAIECAAATLRGFLSAHHNVPEADFASALYVHEGAAALRHLFEVVASLDSQILGETEILGQAKAAWRAAEEVGAAGPLLRAAFERAFFLAKEVRCGGRGGRSVRDEPNGEGAPDDDAAGLAALAGLDGLPASVGSAAAALALKIFDDFRGRRLILFGTGETARTVVRAFRGAGLTEIFVVGRNRERTENFAREEGGIYCTQEDLPLCLVKADIVLTATLAPHPIIRVRHLQGLRACGRKPDHPLVLLDLAVPRNIEPAAMELDNVFLYNLDELEETAEEGRRRRAAVAARLSPRLALEAEALANELADPTPDAAARALLLLAEDLRREECARVARENGAEAAVAEALARFEAKLLHRPLRALKAAARSGEGEDAGRWLSRFFALSPPTENTQAKEQTDSSACDAHKEK